MEDFELTLFDRIEKIKEVNQTYDLEKNAYLSFSGGKDSTVLHYLIDIALPGNKIPRVYFNTGIEYIDMVKFVKELSVKDNRFIIINSGVNIKKMLEEDGYPFKSKQHSHNVAIYQNNVEKTEYYKKLIEQDKSLLTNYGFIHNLPNGVKTNIKYIYGVREKKPNGIYEFQGLP